MTVTSQLSVDEQARTERSIETTSAWGPSIAFLLDRVNRSEGEHDLRPVGLAIHHLTESLQRLVPIPLVEVHRATTIATKQLSGVLLHDDPLVTIEALMTDPERVATVDGQTAAALCGKHWTDVRELAKCRARAAVEGARDVGTSAVLALAATRASDPLCRWWGTEGWSQLVETWLGDIRFAPLLRSALLRTPEYVDTEILTEILTSAGGRR